MKNLFFLGLLLSGIAMAEIRCEYFEDELGIIHLKGTNEYNLAECTGYFHAKDRAYHMDFLRRFAMGMNSEVLGKEFIKPDFFMRTLNLEGHARRIYAELPIEEKNYYISYSNGVNEIFSKLKKSDVREFSELGFLPEKWEPYQSIMLTLFQSFHQTQKTFQQEVIENERLGKYKDKAISLFNSDDVPWETTVLKDGEYKKSGLKTTELSPATKKELQQFLVALPDLSLETGSNSWVVSGEKTKNKKAIFANDPHLELRRPSFWYWVHLSSPEVEAIGGSIPGVPSILSGGNMHMAWGPTNSYYDTADAVVIEEKDFDKLENFRPTIWIKALGVKWPFVFKSFERTKNGYPVIPLDAPHKGQKLVFRWSGFDLKAKDFIGLHQLMKMKTTDEMDTILKTVGIPSWNFIFADSRGKIGYRVVGNLPMKTRKTFASETLTVDQIPFEYQSLTENPSLLHPKRGYVITANNRHYPVDSLYYGGNAYAPGFRAFRIEELLVQSFKNKNLVAEDMQPIQCDTQAVDARFFIPLIKHQLNIVSAFNPEEKQAYDLLMTWDFSTKKDCLACGIFRRTMDNAMDDLKLNEAGLYNWMTKEKGEWLGYFKKAVTEVYSKEKKQFITWENLHRNPMNHISNDERFASGTTIFTEGDQQSVNPGTAKYKDNMYLHNNGASHRILFEMTSPPRVLRSHLGINRGDYFKDPAGAWKGWSECHYDQVKFPLDWNKIKTRLIE